MYERYFILSQRRLSNSPNGNPRFKFIAVDRSGVKVALTTKSDAGWAYRVTDWTHRMISAATYTTSRNTVVSVADLAEEF